MDSLPATFTALCALAFVLGARHGLDADHLATIDGLTRCNARTYPWLARRAGALFSLGHGAVVMSAAALATTLMRGFSPPAWLEIAGAAVSIAFLFGLAILNVRAVLRTAAHEVVAMVGVRGRLLRRFATVHRAWAVAAVGMLFAISFDTLSQAALFALAAGRLGGLAQVLSVATLFVLGMLVIDGVNGAWISGLIRRADRTAAIASRAMALTVAAISFAVGCLTVARLGWPAVAAWTDAHELAAGLGVIVGVAVAFVAAMVMARRRVAPASRRAEAVAA